MYIIILTKNCFNQYLFLLFHLPDSFLILSQYTIKQYKLKKRMIPILNYKTIKKSNTYLQSSVISCTITLNSSSPNLPPKADLLYSLPLSCYQIIPALPSVYLSHCTSLKMLVTPWSLIWKLFWFHTNIISDMINCHWGHILLFVSLHRAFIFLT